MAGLGLVQPGEQPARPPAPAASDESTSDVQPSYGRHRALAEAAVSRARTTVVPTATTRPPAARVSVDQPGRRLRDREPLRLRRLVRLLAGHAGVQHQRRHHDARGHQVDQHLARQRPPGARHLRAARDRGVHVLQVLDRPRAVAGRGSGSATRGGAGTTPGRPWAGSSPATAGSGRPGAAPRCAAARRRAAAAPHPARAGRARRRRVAAARPPRRRRPARPRRAAPTCSRAAPPPAPTAASRWCSPRAGRRAPATAGARAPDWWWVRSWVTTAIRTSSRARPRASGGAVASLPGGSTNRRLGGGGGHADATDAATARTAR